MRERIVAGINRRERIEVEPVYSLYAERFVNTYNKQRHLLCTAVRYQRRKS